MAPTTRGWIVTLAAGLLNLVFGISFTTSLSPDMAPTTAAGGLPWSLVVTGLAFAGVMPCAGALYDRLGPRATATIGAMLIGVGYLAGIDVHHAAFAAGPPSVATVGYGSLTGAGIAFGYASTTPAAVKWFAPQHRGLVCGVVVAGFALPWVFDAGGVAQVVPVFSPHLTHIVLGVASLLVVAGLAQVLASPPPGMVPPYAWEFEPLALGPLTRDANLEWRRAVTTPAFVGLWLILVLCSAAVTGAVVASRAPVSALAGVRGAVPLIAAAVGNLLGRPLAGLASDLIARRWALTGALSLLAIGVLALLVRHGAGSWAAALTIGVGYGGVLAVLPALTFDYFGTSHGGANYGTLFTAWGAGGAVCVLALSRLQPGAGPSASAPALLWALSACLVAAAVALAIRPPDRASCGAVSASGADVRT